MLARQHVLMPYSDRALTNWDGILATVLAVPIGLAWAVLEIVGGTLGCERNTGSCGPRLLPLPGGIAMIVLVAFVLGRVLNRLIARWRAAAH